MGDPKDLRVRPKKLATLAGDLQDMQDHLNKQVRRMDAIVDSIEAGWSGPASTAYRGLHRAAAKDAVRIREVLRFLEEAVRLSQDGFTERELETLESFRRIRVDIASEVDKLSTPNPEAPPSAPVRPRSGLDSL
ncbi:WXG100 family type VII secretion target [Streptomyces sp. NPDC007172]|uniref:WXG100 family type VII secretion target n=1 Tax=Streptomyces sp. NPDC007172 TaxID=3364776 RepID=UPI0036A6F650